MISARNTPKVSVVIPTYNRSDLIGEAIDSLQGQDFKDFEVIIVDDGSTDNTKAVCEAYASADPRVAYVAGDTKNRGPGYCRNKGVKLAKGEFLIFLDSDDLFLPGALSNRVEAIESNDELDLVVFLGEFFERVPGDLGLLWNIPTDIDPLLRFIGEDVAWSTIGPIWRMSAFKRIGGWDETIVMGDDQELHTRALMAGAKYEFIHQVDYAIRRAADGEVQLGHQFSTRDGILSQVKRVENLCEDLVHLDRSKRIVAKKLMAGSLLLRCVQMLDFHNDKEASLEIWQIVRDHRLIALSTYLLGLLWIKKYKSFWGDIAAYLINHLESDDFLLKNRALLATTPTSCLEEEPYDGRFHRQPSLVGSPAVNQGVLRYLCGKMKSRNAITCIIF